MHLSAESRRDNILGKFIDHRQDVLAGYLQSQLAAEVLNDGIELFDDNQAVHLFGKGADQLFRKRVYHAQLQHGNRVPEYFPHVLVRGRGGDDAHLRAAHLDPVDRGCLSVFAEGLRAGLHDRMALLGIAGHHDVLGNVLDVFLLRNGSRSLFHHGLGMGYPCAHFQKHRGVKLLRNLIGQLCEGKGFRGIGGLQHRHLRRNGVMPAVLLILGGVHARVVRHADDQAGIDAGIGHGKERVRRHVQSHMLHAAEGTSAGQTGAEGRFHSHLLIGRPLAVYLVVFCRFFCDLRTGGSRIAGDEAASCLIQSTGNCFVAQHQLFHNPKSFLYHQEVLISVTRQSAEGKQKSLHLLTFGMKSAMLL